MKVIVSITALVSLVLLFEGSLKCVNANPLVEKENNGELSVRSSKLRQRRQAGACGCDATVYDAPNYGGRSLLMRQQNANIHNDWFNDRIESAKISGTCSWIFYRDSNFNGQTFILTPRNYASPVFWGGPGNSVTSARALPSDGTTAILLFEDGNYQGRMTVLYGSHSNLPWIDFNDQISSIIITGGSWRVFDHSDYQGASSTLGQGQYPTLASIGNDRISSVRLN